jgi:hypothetical protein
VLASGLDSLRLTLHVLAASIWVGGQIVLVGLEGGPRGQARRGGRGGFGGRAPRPGHIEGALAVWGSVAGLASKAALAMGILVAG